MPHYVSQAMSKDPLDPDTFLPHPAPLARVLRIIEKSKHAPIQYRLFQFTPTYRA